MATSKDKGDTSGSSFYRRFLGICVRRKIADGSFSPDEDVAEKKMISNYIFELYLLI